MPPDDPLPEAEQRTRVLFVGRDGTGRLLEVLAMARHKRPMPGYVDIGLTDEQADALARRRGITLSQLAPEALEHYVAGA